MTRLSKYIADSGYCSRRAACRMIESGVVLMNDRTGRHTDKVTGIDHVRVHDQLLQPVLPLHLIYNKPVGVDCVCDINDKNSIIHQMPTDKRVFPVGRLDKDSHGLMLLTNDGELCQRIIHPDFYHEKEYQVKVHKPIDAAFCQSITEGVTYQNVTTRPCKIKKVAEDTFVLTLTQGMNRQVRRMCKALGFKVIDLQRTRLINLLLDNIPLNQYRPLSDEELTQLNALTGFSRSY